MDVAESRLDVTAGLRADSACTPMIRFQEYLKAFWIYALRWSTARTVWDHAARYVKMRVPAIPKAIDKGTKYAKRI